jgi:hypothetical protein
VIVMGRGSTADPRTDFGERDEDCRRPSGPAQCETGIACDDAHHGVRLKEVGPELEVAARRAPDTRPSVLAVRIQWPQAVFNAAPCGFDSPPTAGGFNTLGRSRR